VLAAAHLQDEDVVRVVVDREPLRGGGRRVGVGLHGEAEPLLESPAVDGRGMPVQVQGLEDDRGAAGVLGGDPLDARQAGEAAGPPRDLLRVGRGGQR
jgi:hypothetical protein